MPSADIPPVTSFGSESVVPDQPSFWTDTKIRKIAYALLVLGGMLFVGCVTAACLTGLSFATFGTGPALFFIALGWSLKPWQRKDYNNPEELHAMQERALTASLTELKHEHSPLSLREIVSKQVITSDNLQNTIRRTFQSYQLLDLGRLSQRELEELQFYAQFSDQKTLEEIHTRLAEIDQQTILDENSLDEQYPGRLKRSLMLEILHFENKFRKLIPHSSQFTPQPPLFSEPNTGTRTVASQQAQYDEALEAIHRDRTQALQALETVFLQWKTQAETSTKGET